MIKVQLKPLVYDACQWKRNVHDVPLWASSIIELLPGNRFILWGSSSARLLKDDDWIMRDEHGWITVVGDEYFKERFEQVLI